MLHEKCHFTLVVRAFEVNVTRHEMGPSATRLILQSFVNELLDVHHDANKGNLLLLYALCHQVVLEKVRVVDVGANVALFSLFPPKSFL